MKSIRQLIQNLKGWITELGEKRKELLAQKAAEEATLLPNLLMKYMAIRKEERKDWTRAGQNRGTSQDLKAVSEALSYLRQKGLSTVEDLEAFLESSGKSAADYRNQMKPKEARSKVIDGILASRTDCKECKPVYEKYQKIFFKKTKEKFKQEHPEVARYAKAAAYLAKHPDDKDSTQKELQQEQEKLLSEIAELKVPLIEVQDDLKKLRDIRYWVHSSQWGQVKWLFYCPTGSPNILNRISHIISIFKNTLILNQSSIHYVCCIYLSCNPVLFQMLYKTIQITKRSFNNVLTQTSRYNIVNLFFTKMLPYRISTVNKSLHLGTDSIKINRRS